MFVWILRKCISRTEKQGISAWAQSRAEPWLVSWQSILLGKPVDPGVRLLGQWLCPCIDPCLGLCSGFLAAFPSLLTRTSGLASAPRSWPALPTTL